MSGDEVAVFVDAVHPTHAARAVGCWVPKQQNIAIEQTSGRQRINIHGAIDLESGQTRMIEAETIDALSTIRLLESLLRLYPLMACIHVFLDNARYHHAKLVREWLSGPGCRIKLHFLPPYSPDMNPIEKAYSKLKDFLRKVAERTVAGLMNALEACAEIFKPNECANYFKACGYDSD